MGGAHDLVVLPALTVAVFPLAVFFYHRTVAIGEGGFHLAQKIQSVEKVAHFASVFLPPSRPAKVGRKRMRIPVVTVDRIGKRGNGAHSPQVAAMRRRGRKATSSKEVDGSGVGRYPPRDAAARRP
ncbi:hypothetical protein D3C72_2146930 [compost metagenome]